MDYQKPKGTADLLPGTTGLWEKVEANAREVFRQFGYRGIRTPMFEDYRVFQGKSWESRTDSLRC